MMFRSTARAPKLEASSKTLNPPLIRPRKSTTLRTRSLKIGLMRLGFPTLRLPRFVANTELLSCALRLSLYKPDDWDEDAPYEIPDEDAKKPEDWLDDEPLTVPDPDATKPEEWDDEEDGDWIAPTVSNPKCAEVSGCSEWKR